MHAARSIRFPADTAVLAEVRSFAGQACEDVGGQVDQDLLAVVVGELAANAAVHQDGEAELTVASLPDGGIRVTVADHSRAMPEFSSAPAWDVRGHRGLQLIDALATRWGVEAAPPGKRVWAELAPNRPGAGSHVPSSSGSRSVTGRR